MNPDNDTLPDVTDIARLCFSSVSPIGKLVSVLRVSSVTENSIINLAGAPAILGPTVSLSSERSQEPARMEPPGQECVVEAESRSPASCPPTTSSPSLRREDSPRSSPESSPATSPESMPCLRREAHDHRRHAGRDPLMLPLERSLYAEFAYAKFLRPSYVLMDDFARVSIFVFRFRCMKGVACPYLILHVASNMLISASEHLFSDVGIHESRCRHVGRERTQRETKYRRGCSGEDGTELPRRILSNWG